MAAAVYLILLSISYNILNILSHLWQETVAAAVYLFLVSISFNVSNILWPETVSAAVYQSKCIFPCLKNSVPGECGGSCVVNILWQETVAAAVYPSLAATLNHSCNPSLVRSSLHSWLVLAAARDISPGELKGQSHDSFDPCFC